VIIPEAAIRRFEASTAEEGPDVRRDSMASAHSTPLTRETSSSTARTPPVTPVTPVTPDPAQSNFVDVQDTRDPHSLGQLEMTAQQGYIETPNALTDRRQVIARRYGYELQNNFICHRMANLLGLDVRPLDRESKEAGMRLIVGKRGTPISPVGTVTVNWWTTARGMYPPVLRLEMWVFDTLPHGCQIALGAPFEKRLDDINRPGRHRRPLA
jgi:hypothetical protein